MIASRQGAGLLGLPLELLVLITTYLPNIKDVLALTLTCHQLRVPALEVYRRTVEELPHVIKQMFLTLPVIGPPGGQGNAFICQATETPALLAKVPGLLMLRLDRPVVLPYALLWLYQNPLSATLITRLSLVWEFSHLHWDPTFLLADPPHDTEDDYEEGDAVSQSGSEEEDSVAGDPPSSVSEDLQLVSVAGTLDGETESVDEDVPSWNNRHALKYYQTASQINKSLLQLFPDSESAFGIPAALFSPDMATFRPSLHQFEIHLWKDTSPTSVYSAALLKPDFLPNLTTLEITLGSNMAQAKSLLDFIVQDPATLQSLKHLHITPSQYSLQHWGRFVIELDTICQLLGRPKLSKLICHAFGGPGDAIDTPVKPLRTFQLCSARWDKQQDTIAILQEYWPDYDDILMVVETISNVENLAIMDTWLPLGLSSEAAIGLFFRRLMDHLGSNSVTSLRRLQLASKSVAYMTPAFNHSTTETMLVVGRDGVERTFYYLGPTIGNLQGFKHLSYIRIQLAHLVGRQYLSHLGEQDLRFEISLLPGAIPRPHTQQTIHETSTHISHQMPDSLTKIVFLPGVRFSHDPHSDRGMAEDKVAHQLAMRSLLSAKPQWLTRLQNITLPIGYVSPHEQENWTRFGARVAVKVEWNENYTMSDADKRLWELTHNQ